jgi:hypothetical protein
MYQAPVDKCIQGGPAVQTADVLRKMMAKKSVCMVAVGLVTCFSLGCGKKEGAPGPAPETAAAAAAAPVISLPKDLKEACSYLSQAEATELAGVETQLGTAIVIADENACQYDLASSGTGGVSLYVGRTPFTYEEVAGREKAEKLTGVGEHAVWSGHVLLAVKNGLLVAVRVHIGDDLGKQRDIAKAVANKVFANFAAGG